MALSTSFGMASAHTIFSVKYNLKIYTENSFELMHSQQADKNEKSLEVKFKSMTAIESFKIS